jgi:hypothetical protein
VAWWTGAMWANLQAAAVVQRRATELEQLEQLSDSQVRIPSASWPYPQLGSVPVLGSVPFASATHRTHSHRLRGDLLR